ncbi:MAG: DUF4124 domain-containing protein [Stagnimonas sp.]|nr:DUF4124 domain-containing protein [Stagnimonas sp.]
MRAIALVLLLLSASAHAEIYKCVAAGKTTYSDRPCDAAAQPAVLPPLNTIERREGDDLAKSYDERLSRDKKARDQSDAAFLKDHAAKGERDKVIRKAIIDHRAVKGMTASEVQSALGSADETLPDGAWRYRRDGQRITVRFEDGQVSSVSTTTEKKR